MKTVSMLLVLDLVAILAGALLPFVFLRWAAVTLAFLVAHQALFRAASPSGAVAFLFAMLLGVIVPDTRFRLLTFTVVAFCLVFLEVRATYADAFKGRPFMVV